MKKRTAIPYVLLLATTVVCVFFMFRAENYENQLRKKQGLNDRLTHTLSNYQEVARIDSMLVDGNYTGALSSYNESLEKLDDANEIIPLRIAIAEKMLALKAEDKVLDTSGMAKMSDSIQLLAIAGPAEIRKYDSLNFILKKTTVQLNSMRKQLQQKSFGEYLTFKSKKGNRMHYVGRVKNGKANGTGIAILDSGSRYEGEWRDNQRHGQGAFYWKDGEYYVGNYQNDQRNGLGTYYWPNKEKYVGQWKDDKRNGKGTFYSKDGKEITGVWKEDKFIDKEGKSRK